MNPTDNSAAMLTFIREKFGGMLGADLTLLEQPDGLEKLAAKLRSGQLMSRKQRLAQLRADVERS